MIFRLWPQGARLLYRCPFVTKIKWNFLTNFFFFFYWAFCLFFFTREGEKQICLRRLWVVEEKKLWFSSNLQQNKLAVLVQL